MINGRPSARHAFRRRVESRRELCGRNVGIQCAQRLTSHHTVQNDPANGACRGSHPVHAGRDDCSMPAASLRNLRPAGSKRRSPPPGAGRHRRAPTALSVASAHFACEPRSDYLRPGRLIARIDPGNRGDRVMTNTTKPDTTTPEALQAEKALAEQAAAGEKRFDIGQFGEEVRRVMVVAAHPDDLETACGGTIGLLVQAGVEVTLVLGTDGDIGTHDPAMTREGLAAIRREETVAAAQVLGLKDVVFLGRHDGELVADLVLRAEVAKAYRRYQPDTVFTFDPYWSGPGPPRSHCRRPRGGRRLHALQDGTLPPRAIGRRGQCSGREALLLLWRQRPQGRDRDRHLPRRGSSKAARPNVTPASSARAKRLSSG